MHKHQFGIRSADTLVDRSRVSEDAIIDGFGSIVNSVLGGGTHVFGPILDLTDIQDSGVQHSILMGAELERSFVSGATVIMSAVDNSVISRGSKLIYSDVFNSWVDGPAHINLAELYDCDIQGMVQIENCILKGVTTSGLPHVIHSGTWHRPPITQIAGNSGFAVHECLGDNIIVNCQCRPFNWWVKNGQRFGEKLGLDQWQIDAIRSAVHTVRALSNKWTEGKYGSHE